MCLIAICFILFSAHNIFTALYMLFGIPIMLTTVYGDYRLTTAAAVISMAAEVAGELLIFWDPDKVSILMDSMEVINFLISGHSGRRIRGCTGYHLFREAEK